MSNYPELRHFRYFLQLAEELHFRRAAEKLFITQPGLSRQIQQLEAELGVKLLSRNKRNVALTTAGKFLQEELGLLFQRLDETVRKLRQIEAGEEGEVKIGFVGSAMQNIIPQVLLEINRKYPSLHTHLVEMSNHDQVNALSAGKLDIGFARLEQVPPGLQAQTVFEDTFSLVLPSDHPVSEQSFQSLAQMKEESFILFSSDYSQGYFNQVMSLFEEAGFTPKVSHRSVHASTIFRLVENKLGIAIVPSTLQHGFALKVKFIELNNVQQVARLSAIWKSDSNNPALHKFLEVMKATAK